MAAILAFQSLTVFLSRAGAIAAIGILILTALLILTEIFLRTLFSMSTFVTTEFVAYGMAAMSFMALGETLDRGGLIRISMLFNILSAPRQRALETLVCSLTLAAVFVPLWYFGRSVLVNYSKGFTSGTISNMPLWIPEFGMWIGILIFWLRLLSYGLLIAVGLEGVDVEKSTKVMGSE
jgi:TRAP-type C4-dicarboxylate transport system permease small subunit